MKTIALISAFIALLAALQVLARRWRIPHPVLLVIGGTALAFIPGLPTMTIDASRDDPQKSPCDGA